MDERAQDLQQCPVGGDQREEPSTGPRAASAVAVSQPPVTLPRAASGGAGGVAVEVLFAAEPQQGGTASEPLPPPEALQVAVAPRAGIVQAEDVPPTIPAPEIADPVRSEADPLAPEEVREAEAAQEAEVAPTIAHPAAAEPTSAPALLARIPTVAFNRPLIVAAPATAAPMLQRIEPGDRAVDPHGQPGPVVMPPTVPDIAWPPSPREAPPDPPVALPLPADDGARIGRSRLRLVLGVMLVTLASLAGLVLAIAILYRWVDPPTSTLMLGQRLAGTPLDQRWVPLERISPNLLSAVILSEDAHFCRHRGVDWGELKEVIESAGDGAARGGSTITMQVAKNLFLWPSRSYLRKAIEIPLAYVIEVLWPKRRILEIYLNIAEWGPGVFGAEAAARHHFRKPALLLGPREAALLAVSLPNPFDRQAGRPGPGTQRLADNLQVRMRAAPANTACVRARPLRTGDRPAGGRSPRIVSGQGPGMPL